MIGKYDGVTGVDWSVQGYNGEFKAVICWEEQSSSEEFHKQGKCPKVHWMLEKLW